MVFSSCGFKDKGLEVEAHIKLDLIPPNPTFHHSSWGDTPCSCLYQQETNCKYFDGLATWQNFNRKKLKLLCSSGKKATQHLNC
jgi:hypothetical protein